MSHEADRHAFFIYIGAIMLVGLVILLGATISRSEGGRSDQPPHVSGETKL